MGFTLYEDVTGSTMEKNAIDTAILSMVMGQALEFSEEKTRELTAAAILHDAGMLRLPESIVKKEGSLSEQDVEILKTHTIHSFEIMKKEFMYPDYVCEIALQHHEHWDGTGYPRQLSGNYINQCALILSVVDAFIAMVTKKAYRNSMTGYHAMKTLVSDNASYFSPDILKLFVKILGLHPIGSSVLLNNGMAAKIIRVNPDAPLRPVIQMLDGAKIDLLTNKKLFITHAVDIRKNQS
jgi:HD-GYP domain-containing protein (c-di-GMP phosphodiesterase class II)